MKFINMLLLTVACGLIFSSPVFATLDQDGSRFLEELNERDFDSLRDFINTKRTIDVAEKACNLTISGDVRTEWRHLDESCNGNRLRGHDRFDPHSHLPISRNDFDIEFNLRFDYVCDRAWAVAHLQFDNSAGVDDNGHPCEFKDKEKPKHKRRRHHGKRSKCKNKDHDCFCGKDKHCGDKSSDHHCKADPKGYHGSGFCDDLCLKKAYWGYNICCDGASRLDIEVGRRNLYNAFDSKIQFLSRFDGILLSYSTCFECMADFYVKGAAFVVDERVNHFAYAAEIGFLNICDWGLDFKYSIIDWLKNGKNRCCERNPKGFKFIVSQWTLCYRLNPEWLCKPARVYGAFLVNHDGKRHICKRHFCHSDDSEGHHRNHSKNENLGWYLGFTVGEVVQENDWSLDVQYQVIQAFAVPDDDVSGIGRGNLLNDSITTCSHRGNTNFTGWRIEGLYAITDNLTIDSILEWSKQFNKSIGGRHHYSKFEVEAIYAF